METLKVVAVAAGEAHTLALTEDGSIFSWGKGSFGRLGNGDEEDCLYPVPVTFSKVKQRGSSQTNGTRKFVGIAAGAYHSLALEDNGAVWSWGYNIYGQLGKEEGNSSFPCIVKQFLQLASPNSSDERRPLKVASLKAGGMMSLAIDNFGALWMWGSCPPLSNTGGDAKPGLVSNYSPQPVWDFHGRTVAKVACGNEHILALVSSSGTSAAGDLVCYSWGNNKHGQLGLGDTRNRTRPDIVTSFNDDSEWAVYEISCGAFHSAVLTQSKYSNEEIGCKCWTFGLTENGQLGRGTAASPLLPQPVDGLPSDAILIYLDCGLFHTCVVSAAGDVWSWGMTNGIGLYTNASLAKVGDAFSPVRFQPSADELRFVGPLQVACGAAHTVLVAREGYELWAWGKGNDGVLGRGDKADSFVPCPVLWPPPIDESDEGEVGEPSVDYYRSGRGERSLPVEINNNSPAAPTDVQLLQSKLAVMERYASILHVSLFGRPFEEKSLPASLHDMNYFDIRKELENVMESSDDAGLARMEVFYRNMLETVKDKMLKRRIQQIVNDCMSPHRRT